MGHREKRCEVAVVVTSVSEPNEVFNALASGCVQHNRRFIVIGDESSPTQFNIQGYDYYSIDRQLETGFEYALNCPTREPENSVYIRIFISKTLLNGTIVFPYMKRFPRGCGLTDTAERKTTRPNIDIAKVLVNTEPAGIVCRLRGALSVSVIPKLWIRHIVIVCINDNIGTLSDGQQIANVLSSIVIFPLHQVLRSDRRIALGQDVWCPFNSQNTMWWRDAFPLLYLPSYCSFRMTDIWRSFVAQRIAWENGWSILFHEPTVWQKRNEHNLMKDFSDEIPGYLHNERTCEELDKLHLKSGTAHLFSDLQACYEKIVEFRFY